MAQTVWDKIMEDLVAALTAIKVDDGYNFDINEVHYWGAGGFPWTGNLPEIGIVDGRQNIINRMGVDVERWRRHWIVEIVMVVSNDASGKEYSETYQKGLADVNKAVMTDPYRGGNAIDTLIDEAVPVLYELEATIGAIVMGSCQFGHLGNDLYTSA